MTEYTAIGTMARLGPGLSSFLGCDLEVTPTAERKDEEETGIYYAQGIHCVY